MFAIPVSALAGVAGTPATTGFGSNWTVYHGNALGSGHATSGTSLSPLRSAWTSPTLDGELYTEPLVYAGRVVVATENDTVYELAARTGRVMWSNHVGRAVPQDKVICGDIGPSVGITGTPVIDAKRHEIFVVADKMTTSGPEHYLVGLNLYTGKVALDRRVDPPGTTPAAQLQRPGLTLDHGEVVIGFGGNYGDCQPYHGWIAATAESGGPLRTYKVDAGSGQSQGAVWMGGAAPLVDSAGNIWFATGNGSVTSQGGPYDGSDSVTELSASLVREQYFAPSTWYSDNGSDADLGSAAPAFVDGYVFQVGKAHIAYLLNRKHLGGIGHQVATLRLCSEDPVGGLAVVGNTVYVPCGNGVTAVAIRTTSPHMRVLWTTSSGSGGPPIVASGRVWTIDQYGTLSGLNPASGGAAVQKHTNAGEPDHFQTPTVADGLLLEATTDHVYAFDGPAGLPPPPPPPSAPQKRPGPASNPAATACDPRSRSAVGGLTR